MNRPLQDLAIAGALLAGGGLSAISRMNEHTPTPILGALLSCVGAGIGFFVQIAVLAGQNAVAYSDFGVATGALNFFKTIG